MRLNRHHAKFDAAAWLEDAKGQFENLDRKDPSLWPVIPRVLLCVGIALLTAGAAWYFYLGDFENELAHAREQEVTLSADYERKLLKAVSLDGLKQQREEVQQSVTQLERQLPSKSEMSALLSDINQAGLGRSLQFELFRPGAVVVSDYYAELPIMLRVTGQFHDMGAFASDVAHLSRIVTLNNLSISPSTKGAGGDLVMEATARTYRYLDAEEIQAQRNTIKGGKP